MHCGAVGRLFLGDDSRTAPTGLRGGVGVVRGAGALQGVGGGRPCGDGKHGAAYLAAARSAQSVAADKGVSP